MNKTITNTTKIYIAVILLVLIFGCEKKEPYIEMKISAELTQVSEFGLADGSIDVTITGGLEPYIYNWSNGESTEDLSDLIPGIYKINVTDAEHQSLTDTFEITQPFPDSIKIKFTIMHPTSTGSADGSITTTVSGGYAPFGFLWSNGANTKNIDNLPADSYTLTVSDSRGQTETQCISLTDSLTDIDGNIYSTVKIGEQIWMGENLRVTHAPDGNGIPFNAYDNNLDSQKIYGLLYSWNSAMNDSTNEKSQGICPNGWHVPTDNEFKQLEIFLGMTQQEADMTNIWRGDGIGTSLKKGGSSGYNAQLSGRRSSSGLCRYRGRMEYMWTSSEYNNMNAWRRCLDSYANNVGRWNTFPKTYGFSVRCIKDE